MLIFLFEALCGTLDISQVVPDPQDIKPLTSRPGNMATCPVPRLARQLRH